MPDPIDVQDPPVVAFDRHGYTIVFRSLTEAASWMEAIDVDDNEYVAVYALDGRSIRAATAHEAVVLTLTEERNDADLRRRLDECRIRDGLRSPSGDIVGIANELLRREWEQRWPRRPRWLSRRRRDPGPPQIGPGEPS